MMYLIDFTYDFSEHEISPHEVFIVLGYQDADVPDPIPLTVNEILMEAREFGGIKGGHALLKHAGIYPDSQLIILENTEWKSPPVNASDATSGIACTGNPGKMNCPDITAAILGE